MQLAINHKISIQKQAKMLIKMQATKSHIFIIISYTTANRQERQRPRQAAGEEAEAEAETVTEQNATTVIDNKKEASQHDDNNLVVATVAIAVVGR